MQFGVLGPLQVIAGDFDEPDTVSAARLRALLAVLLWRANQPVPVAELVWDGAPPSGAPEATRALYRTGRTSWPGVSPTGSCM